MRLPGYATPEGTLSYLRRSEEGQRTAAGHFRQVLDELYLSSLGMGSYLGQPDPVTDTLVTEAVLESVDSGAVNVLDTAINYRFMLAERAIGKALRMLLEVRGIPRDELFICSKNGFLTPDADSPLDFRSYFTQRYIDSGLITADDIAGGMHCMAPAYLNDQLNQSLENLQLQTLDLMYLHNAAESQIPAVGRDVFMKRLQQAFAFYEQAREDGRIRYYGMATWTCFRSLIQDSADPASDYLSLETVVKLAESVGGTNHGFRFIQAPYNSVMTELADLENQPYSKAPAGAPLLSTVEVAQELGIQIFASVPLLQGKLLTYSSLSPFKDLQTPAQQSLQFVRTTPGILAPLVGHKHPEHVAENLKVAQVSPNEDVSLVASLQTTTTATKA